MLFYVIVFLLSFQIGCLQISVAEDNALRKLASLHSSKNFGNRTARCTPCGDDSSLRKPVSNNLDPAYRGNGADNLGYDWSPKAWGGLAYPQKSKNYMPDTMRGRGAKQMPMNWNQVPQNIRIVCDTCRAYWEGTLGGGIANGPGGVYTDGTDVGGRGVIGGRTIDVQGGGTISNNHGHQFTTHNQQFFHGGRSWSRGRSMKPQDFETRVTSSAVGVLVKPGSRIAYIPSRSGDMLWDGVSGGGTRWDGFSNGISWVGNDSPRWDRKLDPDYRGGKSDDFPSSPQRFEHDYPANNRPWDEPRRPLAYEGRGRGYYFSDGAPNSNDPQWRNMGYASNWHYGSTTQNGWNSSGMKWNYGTKQWDENDRSSNQFYFNPPEDRGYSSGDRNYLQYGDQYSNYQTSTEYSRGYKPRPSWSINHGYRLNNRDPSRFPIDEGRPWDYNSGSRYDERRPHWRPRPESEKYSPSDRYDKYDSSDKNDYGHGSGYGSSKPSSGSGGGFPFGGNQYPGGDGNHRPERPSSGNLFVPNEENLNHRPSSGYGGSSSRPSYHSSSGSTGGGYAGVDNHIPTYPSGGSSRPYGGEKPSDGGSNVYSSGGNFGSYPTGGSSRPVENNRPNGYSGSFSSSDGYPFGGSLYPSRPYGGYGGVGVRPDGGYHIGGSRPEGGYPTTVSRPSGGYPSGGSRPDGYLSGYPSGSSPYPNRPSSGYSGTLHRPTDGSYPTGGRPSGGYVGGGGYYAYGPDGSYQSGGSSYPTRPNNEYSGSNSRPSSGYSSGGYKPDGGYPAKPATGYPSGGGSRPSVGGYSSTGSRPDSGYSSGSRPGSDYSNPGDSYPSRPSGGYSNGGRPEYEYHNTGGNSYPTRPSGGYSSGGRPDGEYHNTGGSSYSNRPSGGYSSGSRPNSEYPSSGSRPDSGYSSGGSDYNGVNRPSGYSIGGGSPSGYPFGGDKYPGNTGSSYPSGGSSTGYSGGSRYPNERPGGYSGGDGYPDNGGSGGYTNSGSRLSYFSGGQYSYFGMTHSYADKYPPKGYYTGFITELSPSNDRLPYGGGGSTGNYPNDKNSYPGKYKDPYPYGGDNTNRYPSYDKDRYPSFGEDRYAGGGGGDNYSSGAKDKYSGGNRFYFYGQHMSKDKYPGNYIGDNDYDRNHGSDNNSWNYGENDRKDGMYRRTGGSYPPYRGGQYFTSSYLASMSTPSGATIQAAETKTQPVTKSDEVTQPTSTTL